MREEGIRRGGRRADPNPEPDQNPTKPDPGTVKSAIIRIAAGDVRARSQGVG